jgi:hypothetical protein
MNHTRIKESSARVPSRSGTRALAFCAVTVTAMMRAYRAGLLARRWLALQAHCLHGSEANWSFESRWSTC